MQIVLNSSGIKLEIVIDENKQISNINEIILKASELFAMINSDTTNTQIASALGYGITANDVNIALKEIDKNPMVRDRLPNEPKRNEPINLTKIKVNKAKETRPYMRCPHCGQAFSIVAKFNDSGILFVRDVDKKDADYKVALMANIKEVMQATLRKKRLTNELINNYYNDLLEVIEKKKPKEIDFYSDNNTILTCPVCLEEAKQENWQKAYEHPEEFFEYDNMCNICGGEVTKVIKENKQVNICEACGREKMCQ